MEFDLLINAIIAGLMLGGFYAAVTAGISISFGMLDIVNIAHPGFIILGSYIAYIVNSHFGVDPILDRHPGAAGVLCARLDHLSDLLPSFEKHGQDSLRGLAFFFGLLFVTEVALNLVFGVDYRSVNVPYIGGSVSLGAMEFPVRMLVPCLVSLPMFGGLQLYSCRAPSSAAR